MNKNTIVQMSRRELLANTGLLASGETRVAGETRVEPTFSTRFVRAGPQPRKPRFDPGSRGEGWSAAEKTAVRPRFADPGSRPGLKNNHRSEICPLF
jgi:hypothetical protein